MSTSPVRRDLRCWSGRRPARPSRPAYGMHQGSWRSCSPPRLHRSHYSIRIPSRRRTCAAGSERCPCWNHCPASSGSSKSSQLQSCQPKCHPRRSGTLTERAAFSVITARPCLEVGNCTDERTVAGVGTAGREDSAMLTTKSRLQEAKQGVETE